MPLQFLETNDFITLRYNVVALLWFYVACFLCHFTLQIIFTLDE